MALPDPVGEQSKVVYLDHEGHTVVLGTAGSGKTTMAVHRAIYLGHPETAHSGRVLLLSFNKSLLGFLRHLFPPGIQNVDFHTYHRFARGYLASRGLMEGSGRIANNAARLAYVEAAVTEVREAEGDDPILDRPTAFFAEEIRWMAQHGVTSEEQYSEIKRVGRGDDTQLTRDKRPLVFAVAEAYRRGREAGGQLYDWDDIANYVWKELIVDDDERRYRHVVVDEGQDFSPAMLRSLAAAIPANGSLTYFGDVAQQIYGRGISWRQAGLEISSPAYFRKNYRNSPQIAELGMAIAKMPYYDDVPDMVLPTDFAAAGPMPSLVHFDDPLKERDFVLAQAREQAASGSVGIVLTRHEDEPPFRTAFPDAQVLSRDLALWSPDPGISYGTVHSAKGYEFDTVIIPGLSDDRWPDYAAMTAEGDREAESAYGRLLYVGVTRARQNLIMTCTGAPTDLLPRNDGLWQESNGS